MIDEEQPVVSVAQMARQIGVHRSNASRLAATLHSMGFLTRVAGGGQYRLGPELIRLGRLSDRDTDLVQQAMGPLRRLVADRGETGHVAVLDGLESVTVAAVDGWHTVRMHSQINKRFPAWCSAHGKSLLSGLDDDELRDMLRHRRLTAMTPHSITSVSVLLRELAASRARGYSVDMEEVEPGLCCVAAPIRDAGGAVVASLGLSGPSVRMTPAMVVDLSPAVRRAAADVSTAMGAVHATAVAGPLSHAGEL